MYFLPSIENENQTISTRSKHNLLNEQEERLSGRTKEFLTG